MQFQKKLLIPYDAIQKRVRELARQISIDYRGKDTVLIGMLNGAVFFFSDLALQLTVPAKIDFIRASSYGSQMISSGKVKLTKDVELSVTDKSVLIIEDIVDTGLTVSHVISHLNTRDPESVEVCALIDKSERREINVAVRYCGFRLKEGFVVGYGLDCNEEYRCLKDIYTLE
jgi:hypoxanthine phosphoribosyltransferase